MTQQLSEYQSFVRSLEATAQSSQRERLLHGALGLTCEYLEFSQAETIGGKVKEMGDICYFLTVIVDALGGRLEYVDEAISPGADVRIIEAIASEVKRRAFYGRQAWTDEEVLYACNRLVSFMLTQCDFVLDVNVMKLRARYPAGRFDASDAMARADEAADGNRVA